MLHGYEALVFCLIAQPLEAKDVFACSPSITEYNSKNLFLCFSPKFAFLNVTLFFKL